MSEQNHKKSFQIVLVKEIHSARFLSHFIPRSSELEIFSTAQFHVHMCRFVLGVYVSVCVVCEVVYLGSNFSGSNFPEGNFLEEFLLKTITLRAASSKVL